MQNLTHILPPPAHHTIVALAFMREGNAIRLVKQSYGQNYSYDENST
jgi:hypothetical protein